MRGGIVSLDGEGRELSIGKDHSFVKMYPQEVNLPLQGRFAPKSTFSGGVGPASQWLQESSLGLCRLKSFTTRP